MTRTVLAVAALALSMGAQAGEPTRKTLDLSPAGGCEASASLRGHSIGMWVEGRKWAHIREAWLQTNPHREWVEAELAKAEAMIDAVGADLLSAKPPPTAVELMSYLVLECQPDLRAFYEKHPKRIPREERRLHALGNRAPPGPPNPLATPAPQADF